MKTFLRRLDWSLLTTSFILLLLPFVAPAQVVYPFPVVTIEATQPIAKESGQPAIFNLIRTGPTNAALLVYCKIGGTASNGVDYQQISSFNLIPAGATS